MLDDTSRGRKKVIRALGTEEDEIDLLRMSAGLSEEPPGSRHGKIRGTFVLGRDVTLEDSSLSLNLFDRPARELSCQILIAQHALGQIIFDPFDLGFHGLLFLYCAV